MQGDLTLLSLATFDYTALVGQPLLARTKGANPPEVALHDNDEVDLDSLHRWPQLTYEKIRNSTDGERFQKFFIDLNLSTCSIAWISTPPCLSTADASTFK